MNVRCFAATPSSGVNSTATIHDTINDTAMTTNRVKVNSPALLLFSPIGIKPATVTSASNQLRGFLASYKSGNAKKQALDDLASKLNASAWSTQWHPVYDYDNKLTELVKLVGPAAVSAGIINGTFNLLIGQAGRDRQRFEYNRPDKKKKSFLFYLKLIM